MSAYNVVMRTNNTTVLNEYTPIVQNRTTYQSESDLENHMIEQLQGQGYERPDIHTKEEAFANLRTCMEELNRVTFSDSEWERMLKDVIFKSGSDIKTKTRNIQQTQKDGTFCSFKLDDGHEVNGLNTINIMLIDKENIYRNKVQVINQYVIEGNRKNRYDVTILVNGLPLVHCELKRRGVPIKEAFNQIERYQKDSFWADEGFYEYIQIFIISNGSNTKYYSNTTRYNHINFIEKNKRVAQKECSNSFEFTSYWADATNKKIEDLVDFTATFLAKETLLKILTRYCVFDVDENLLVMRPYQIVATERIINQLIIANNYKKFGTIDAGGFIWHTTGSGKTLTSFKTAQLVTNLGFIDKVLFVVDRQDLDYQTIKEYDRFEKGVANGSKNTKILESNIEDDEKRIIVTTIQKLNLFIKKHKNHEIYNKNIVIIFDECHRSQFGEFHKNITEKFQKYALFGFTGTPIFVDNAVKGQGLVKTTEQLFGKKLHTYTIVDAIADKNVLPFRIDYINSIKNEYEKYDELTMRSEARMEAIVKYILEHYDQKTMQSKASYTYKKEKKRKGFNSIFAVKSIDMAKGYYEKFKKIMEENPELTKKVGIIYSYQPNNESETEENSDDTTGLSNSDRDFLERAIQDYNQMFNTNFDTGSSFTNYYKDLSQKVKDGEIDILIVVNMFLTGFDAPTLNTLWVDKSLFYHTLIQAFSRTNRILNSIKAYGNIVCFDDDKGSLQSAVNDAITLFGNRDANGIILAKTYKEYIQGYDEKDEEGNIIKHHEGYETQIEKLLDNFPLDNFSEIMMSEKEQKEFVKLFSSILRTQNILKSFDEFKEDESSFLNEAQMQDYLSKYTDLHEEFKQARKRQKLEDSTLIDDVVFEMELVEQITVDVDYVINLIHKNREEHKNFEEMEQVISRAINSNPELKLKKELINNFIKDMSETEEDIHNAWLTYKSQEKEKEIEQIIEKQNLKDEETKKLVDKLFRIGQFDVSEIELSKILPTMSRFDRKRQEKKNNVRDILRNFFRKYFD